MVSAHITARTLLVFEKMFFMVSSLLSRKSAAAVLISRGRGRPRLCRHRDSNGAVRRLEVFVGYALNVLFGNRGYLLELSVHQVRIVVKDSRLSQARGDA